MNNMVTNRANSNTYYNYTDLNRVEGAVREVADMLTAEGYYVTVTVKTNWSRTTRPTENQMNRYIGNILLIERQFVPAEGVTLPKSMRGLNYIGANNIEKFLAGIPALVSGMTANYRRCNTFNCGRR